jgi:hypothetical protein
LSGTGFLLRNLPFAIENDIAWRLNIRLRRRPSSAPFLSGDTFRTLAGHVIEENEEFFQKGERRQGIVFCASTLSENRLRTIRNEKEYVLIVHHGDVNLGESFLRALDSSLCRHCFGQNCFVRDPRITPLPIGLEDQWHHQHGNVRDFLRIRRSRVQKSPTIVWGFSLNTNPDERWPCYRALLKCRFAHEVPIGINSRLYKKFINRSMFIASPPGNGADCFRTWEALYLRIVPIVKRSVISEYFTSIGLPLLIVDDWREMISWTQDFLSEEYTRLLPGFSSEKLWLPYWNSQFQAHLSRGS